jgi:tetratricopeptide (TPR) repeat protein
MRNRFGSFVVSGLLLLGLGLLAPGLASRLGAQSFQELADAAMFKGDFKKAVDLREQALVTALKAFKEDDLEVIKIRAELGEAYRAAGRWKDALQQLDYAWKRLRFDAETKSRWKMEEGTMSLTLAERLGRTCQAARRHEDALTAFTTGLADCVKAGREGAYAMHFTALLVDTSLLLKRDADADGYMQKALDLLEKGDRPVSERAGTLIRLASIYTDHQQFAKAEPLARRALNMLKTESPSEKESQADAEEKLALILVQLDQREESEQLLLHALEVQKGRHSSDGAELISIHCGLAALSLKQGKNPEALAQAQEALRICKKHNPEQHPQSATCLLLLGTVELASGHRTPALDACRQAAEIFEATLGDEHPQSRAARDLLEKARKI